MEINNTLDLYNYLKKEYKDRFQADIEMAKEGEIEGTIDNNYIYIIFDKNNILTASTFDTSKSLLYELVPIFNSIMNNVNPLCTYELHHKDKNYPVVFNIEWDLVNPSEKIKNIIDEVDFPDELRMKNFKLYNFSVVNNNVINFPEKKSR